MMTTVTTPTKVLYYTLSPTGYRALKAGKTFIWHLSGEIPGTRSLNQRALCKAFAPYPVSSKDTFKGFLCRRCKANDRKGLLHLQGQ